LNFYSSEYNWSLLDDADSVSKFESS